MNADRNLLLGILALQNNFVDRHQLIVAFDRWISDKTSSLGRILLDAKAISADEHQLLEALVARHLERHEGDAEKSLADLTPVGSVREELQRLADGDLDASLAHVSAAREDDPHATQPFLAGEATSAGTRFRILRPHARGGLGEVYVARDEELHREVALKEIQQRHAHDRDSRARFLLEAEITGGLEHPGIVPVYGLGTYADGRPFYAMRFIKGDSLKEAIERFHSWNRGASVGNALRGVPRAGDNGDSVGNAVSGDPGSVGNALCGVPPILPLPAGERPGEGGVQQAGQGTPQRAYPTERKRADKEAFSSLEFRKLLGRFVDVCNAIEYAHSRGVLHRDLKPGNIMLGKYGETLVVDWGLAKVVGRSDSHTSDELTLKPSSGSGSSATQMGSAVGTPQYMSPEQAEGRLDQLGPASDVYSLGATLYTLLTGQPPISRDDDLGKMLARVAKGEYPPPRAVNRDIPRALEAICLKAMSHRPVDRYSSPRVLADDLEHWLADEPLSALRDTRGERIARWSRRHRAWARSIAAALALVTVVSVIAAIGIDRARRAANDAEGYATRQATRADNEAKVARLAEGKARGESKRAESLNREASRSDFATAQARLAEDKWQQAIAYLGRSLRYNPRNANAWDALWLAALYGVRDAGGLPAFEVRHDDQVVFACFSPDGTRIVTASLDKTARIWNAVTGQPTCKPLQHRGPVVSASFTRDGMRIVTTGFDKTAQIWDAATGQPTCKPLQHRGPVVSASFTRDGMRIVTTGFDKTAQIWDAATGDPIGEPLRHREKVNHASFSADGTRIVTASDDHTARIWDAASGEPIGEPLQHLFAVLDCSFSPDGTQIVTACGGPWFSGSARLWQVTTSEHIVLGHESRVMHASFSPDGTRIVTASWDNTARIWSATTGKRIGKPLRHEEKVTHASFSPDGTRIVTAGLDKTARIWSAATGERIGESLRHENAVKHVSFSPDGTRIVTASSDKTARVWDAATGQPIREPLGHKNAVEHASFSTDGAQIITTSGDHTARIWNAATARVIRQPLLHGEAVFSAFFSADGKRIFSTAMNDDFTTTVRVWDATTGEPIGVPLRHGGPPWVGTLFSADGTRIVTGLDDKTARIWDAATGQPIGEPLRHRETVNHVSFNADGTRIVTASDDHTARIWDAVTGQPIGEPLRHREKVNHASFSADGTRILTTSSDGTARVWDVATGQPIGEPLRGERGINYASFSPDGKEIVATAKDETSFSPDGKRIVTAGKDKTLQIWDAATSQAIGELLPSEEGVEDASLSQDEKKIVTVTEDKSAWIWDVATRRPIGEPLRHTEHVYDASFSPDGARVVTASQDKTARVWDAVTGLLIGQPLRHEDMVVQASFNVDGTRIVTASADKTAGVWEFKGRARLNPSLAPRFASFLSGAALEPRLGTVAFLSDEERLKLWQQLESPLAEFPEWLFLARTVFSRPPDSPVSPHSSMTRREAATRLIRAGERGGIQEALSIDPGHSLLQIALARLEEKSPARADFLREYGLAHLPDDAAYCCEAGEMLIKQKDRPRAARAIQKAAKLDPRRPDFIRLRESLQKLKDS